MLKEPRYRVYSEYLTKKYRKKVYKLPLNLPLTCPNRDGLLGNSGCTFCGDEAVGFESLSNQLTVEEQLEKNMAYIKENYRAEKFIAYFQNFTNTYLPIDQFRDNLLRACLPDIVELAISTRPDCLHDDYLQVLAEVQEKQGVEISLEMGLQTVNYHTLRKIKRGHTLAEFIDATRRVQRFGFQTCAHVILNLPGDNLEDVIETAKIISALDIEQVKIHSLYIVKGSPMAEDYVNGQLPMISLDEYLERMVAFLEYLNPEVVLQRLFGRAPKERTLFCNWGRHWAQIKASLDRLMDEKATYQGRRFDYLGGKKSKEAAQRI